MPSMAVGALAAQFPDNLAAAPSVGGHGHLHRGTPMLILAATGVGAVALGTTLMRWGAHALTKDALAGWDYRILIGAALVGGGLAILVVDILIWGLLG